MVVIEQEQQERKETVTHPPKASTDSKATENGDAFDGFETASEHDVSDNDDDKGNSDHREEGREVATPEQKDKTNDDELKQKALSEANDAKVQGNKLFGEGKYDDALLQYEVALQKVESAPETNELRSICHSNRGVCFFKLAKYEDSIKECTKALELNPTYMKALTRRAEANEKLEHFEEAIADLKKILELDSSNDQARKSIRRLEPLAAEKREKMKEEMIAKLKDMGNSLLGRFGMSVDNFKTVKDPNTGSYSIQFQR